MGSESKMTGWPQMAALILGAIGTFLGAIGTYSSGAAKSRIDALQVQYQSDVDFSSAIHNSGNIIALRDAGGTRAMVEFSSLYARTESVPHKLIIIEIAQTAKQSLAMIALSGIAQADMAIQSPQPNDATAANRIKQDINTFANDEFTKAQRPAKPTAGIGQTSREVKPADDPPLTQSTVPLVRANAALVAALPAGEVSGWAFVGDASGKDRNAPNAALDASSDAVNKNAVPASTDTITACQDINIRSKPFQGDELGPVVGIAQRGSALKVTPTADNAAASLHFDTRSARPPHNPITAWWVHVTVGHVASSQAC